MSLVPSTPPSRNYLKATALPDQTLLSDFVITPKGKHVRRQPRFGPGTSIVNETMSSLFDRLRGTIKETGKTGMFLYGTPSINVIRLLLRIYNENILRNGDVGINDYRDIKLMIGVAELHGGDLYITLAEDPREDPDYAKKVKLLYTLLVNSNCVVEYPEHAQFHGIKDNQTALGIVPSDLFPSTRIEFGYQNTNRSLRRDIFSKNKEHLLNNTADSYIGVLTPQMRVKFVHSIKYLLQRRAANTIAGSPRHNPESLMYPPYKRPEDLIDGQDTGLYTCNNGSTCSESKMFGYLYDNIAGFNFSQIIGYAAYWIGHRQPPTHSIKSYNYIPTDPLFNEIGDVIKPIIGGITGYDDIAVDKINKFIQPFALPCPGCFSNYGSYTNNTRVKVDTSDCIHVGRIGQIARVQRRLLTTRESRLPPPPPAASKKGGARRRNRTIRRRRSSRAATRRRRHSTSTARS